MDLLRGILSRWDPPCVCIEVHQAVGHRHGPGYHVLPRGRFLSLERLCCLFPRWAEVSCRISRRSHAPGGGHRKCGQPRDGPYQRVTLRGVVARWNDARCGSEACRDPAVGRGDRERDRHAPGAYDPGEFRGVLSRWGHAGLQRLRSDDQAVGRGHGCRSRHSRGDGFRLGQRCGFLPGWHDDRVGPWQWHGPGLGPGRPGSLSPPSRGPMPGRSQWWLFLPTVRGWPP